MLSLSLEKRNISFNKNLKFYILTIIFIILQSSILIKYLVFLNLTPNLLLILLIIYSLNFNFLENLKFAIFVGIFKDLLNPQYILLDLPLYLFYILVISFIKERTVSSNQFIRLTLAILIILLDYGLKNLIFYIESGYIDINKNIILYVILNISIFFILDKILSVKNKSNGF